MRKSPSELSYKPVVLHGLPFHPNVLCALLAIQPSVVGGRNPDNVAQWTKAEVF